MSQTPPVTHRGGQLAYPTWAAQTHHPVPVTRRWRKPLRGFGAGGPGPRGCDAQHTPCKHQIERPQQKALKALGSRNLLFYHSTRNKLHSINIESICRNASRTRMLTDELLTPFH
jgi:hypothetical protein